jgi:hypothetical protein
MKTILLLLVIATAAASAAADDTRTIFDFSQEADLQGWEIQDDVVMGGVSQGRFTINEEGHGVFSGNVSLENDGGFSSFQYNFGPVDVSAYRAICLRIKSDGKPYQLRVESEKNVRHGYAYDFETSGDWQVIEIPFDQMYAIRHGDRLDLPNYPGQTLAQVQILIGNGKAETFQLEIDKIWVK